MYRRQYLAVVGCLGSSVTGCLGFGGTNETVRVGVENKDSAARKLTVTVEFSGETLIDETMTVEPGETADTSLENPDSAGEALVSATAATGAKTSSNIRVGPGTGIRYITVVAQQDGSLRIMATRT